MDDEFHSAIAHASGSPQLAADIDCYRLMHRFFNRSHTNAGVLQQAAEEHAKVLTARQRRQPEEARQAMREHFTSQRNGLGHRLDHVSSEPR